MKDVIIIVSYDGSFKSINEIMLYKIVASGLIINKLDTGADADKKKDESKNFNWIKEEIDFLQSIRNNIKQAIVGLYVQPLVSLSLGCVI